MILFLVSLILIIIIHEFSHFLAAKICHCGIDIVSLGFGRPLYRKEYRGIIYQITPFIFGGYVKLRDELKNSYDSQAFTNLTYTKKVLIALAGVTANIIIGLIAFYLGKIIHHYYLLYFGFLSVILGITNAIPFPALDGSYPILVWLEKFYGKEKGYNLMAIINRIGFAILMALQIACIPWIIYMIHIKGGH